MAAMDWLRLWHDMPNDPKWRTIARVSKQPISLVLSVFLHLMVDASRNVTRGHASVTHEDLASALDSDEQQISDILEAMQGRVLDGMVLAGWSKRQPKREDAGDGSGGPKSAAQRKKEQREREKSATNPGANDSPNEADMSRTVTQSHAESRDVTLDKSREDKSNNPSSLRSEGEGAAALPPPAPAKPRRAKGEARPLSAYLVECRTAGVKPIPDDHAVRRWAQDAGIAPEMLQIAWVQFRERYTEGEKGKRKRYIDWPSHFATAVKGNWFKLWFHGESGVVWTSGGLMHKQALDAHIASKQQQGSGHAPE